MLELACPHRHSRYPLRPLLPHDPGQDSFPVRKLLVERSYLSLKNVVELRLNRLASLLEKAEASSIHYYNKERNRLTTSPQPMFTLDGSNAFRASRSNQIVHPGRRPHVIP
jgi:hypothetical protein